MEAKLIFNGSVTYISRVQTSTVITQFTLSLYYIRHCDSSDRNESVARITIATAYTYVVEN